jgi:MFS family permease
MLTNYRNIIRMFNRDTQLLLIAAMVVGFSYTGVYVTLFNLYLLRLGYGPVFIGQINAAAQLGFALFSLPAGAIGSRWGSQRAASLGLGLAVVTLGILPLAESLPDGWQTGWLSLTFIAAWLVGALYLVNNYPLLMNITGPAERNHAFSVRQALVPLGTFAGSLTSGFLPGIIATFSGFSLDQPAPYRYALFSAAGVLVVGTICMWLIRDAGSDRLTRSITIANPMPAGLIGYTGLVVLLYVAGNGAAGTFFNIYLDRYFQVSTAWIGSLAAIGQLLAVPVALITPLAVARWGKRQTILIGIWGLSLSLLLLALVPHWFIAGVAFMGVSAAYSFVTPVLMICQQEIVPPEWRAVMSGVVVTARGLGSAAIAFSGGHIIASLGYSSLFLTGAILAAMAVALFWGWGWAPRWLLTRRVIAGIPVKH